MYTPDRELNPPDIEDTTFVCELCGELHDLKEETIMFIPYKNKKKRISVCVECEANYYKKGFI